MGFPKLTTAQLHSTKPELRFCAGSIHHHHHHHQARYNTSFDYIFFDFSNNTNLYY